MTLRITTQTMTAAAGRQLASAQERLAAAQQTATSRQRIARPSDDPSGTAEALRVRADIAANARYGRNIDNGTAWLTGIDAALSDAGDLLNAAKDAVQQGLNDARTPTDRAALATAVDGARSSLLAVANRTQSGRNLFAGTTDTAAFTDATPPVYTGVAGASVQRQYGPETSVRVDADGAAIFGSGTGSVFALLDRVSASLRAGTTSSTDLADLQTALDTVRGARAEAGVRLSTLTAAKDTNQADRIALEANRSSIEDVDFGTALLDLQVQQTSYQAALAVTAKTLQPSLMDFLR